MVQLTPADTSVKGMIGACIQRTLVKGFGAFPRSGLNRYVFDQDRLGELFRDAQAGVADLANEARIPRQELNLLLLKNTQFAQAIGHLGVGDELFDTNSRSGLNLAQRANRRPGALAFQNLDRLLFLIFHRG